MKSAPTSDFTRLVLVPVAPERVRRDLALLIPSHATLAAVLSLYENGIIPESLRFIKEE